MRTIKNKIKYTIFPSVKTYRYTHVCMHAQSDLLIKVVKTKNAFVLHNVVLRRNQCVGKLYDLQQGTFRHLCST